jgi:hypothetical protein
VSADSRKRVGVSSIGLRSGWKGITAQYCTMQMIWEYERAVGRLAFQVGLWPLSVSVMLGLVCLPLLHQPRLDKSAKDAFPRYARLGLQGCQQIFEFICWKPKPLRESSSSASACNSAGVADGLLQSRPGGRSIERRARDLGW